MKFVTPRVAPELLERRRQIGADQWDELWEGVLHVPPAPNADHQSLEGDLEVFLKMRWARPNGCKVLHQINVAPRSSGTKGWPHNYRIPDLVLLTPERFHIDKNAYFEGGPNAVVEIRSPGDACEEKLAFYAEIGVDEVWIIDRDTREPEIYDLASGAYRRRRADDAGWTRSRLTGITMKATEDSTRVPRLAMRIGDDDTTLEHLPHGDA